MKSGLSRIAKVVLLSAVIAGCGRTGQHGSAADGGTPPVDGFNLPDGGDAGPCQPSCADLCQPVARCLGGNYDQCLGLCRSSDHLAIVRCLAQLVCAEAEPSCEAVRRCLENPAVPDLAFDSYAPASPARGQLAHAARVCNMGTGDSLPSTVHFYRDRNRPPQPGEPGSVVVGLAPLAPGLCVNVQQSEAGLPAGTYRAWAQIDAEGWVVELDEQNNVAGPRPVQVAGGAELPDLVIHELQAHTGGGSQVTLTYEICNTGTASVSNEFVWGLYTAPPVFGAAPDLVRGFGRAGLAPGQCSAEKHSVRLPFGNHRVWALVDVYQQVTEGNEGNNSAGPVSFTIGGLPDLVIQGFRANLGPGGEVQYSGDICNHGDAPADVTEVAIFADQVMSAPTQLLKVPPLPPGLCQPLVASVPLPPGTYRSTAHADFGNRVAERDERNNLAGPLTVVVPGDNRPDLIVAAFSGAPTPGGAVIYIIRVCNRGAGSSTGVLADLYFDRPTPPTPGVAGDRRVRYPSLGPGVCLNQSLLARLPPGAYLSWVYVDRQDLVAESDEGNNIGGPVQLTVAGGEPDLQILDFFGYESRPGRVTYSVTVCNFGPSGTTGTNFWGGLYYDRSTAPGPLEPSDQAMLFGPLAAGACVTQRRTARLAAGSYASWYHIDNYNNVAESDESNNVAGPVKVEVSVVGQADLTVASLVASELGGEIIYDFAICNQGNGSAAQTRAYLFYDLPAAPQPGQPGSDHDTAVPALSAGGCSYHRIVGRPPPGPNRSWIYVDLFDRVPETDEGNNAASIEIFAPDQLPDLVVGSLRAIPRPGGGAIYTVGICNRGFAASTPTEVVLAYDSPTAPPPGMPADATLLVGAVRSGGCEYVVHHAPGLQPGNYSSWARVDPFDRVAESDESNNVAGPEPVVLGNSDCTFICNTLVNPCGMLPPDADSLNQCVQICSQQAPDQIACADRAARSGECMQILQCLFAP